MADVMRVRVLPPVEMLAFSIEVPADFRQVPLPAEEQDFSKRDAMMPLGLFMASYGAVLCTVAARPKGGETSVMEWAMFMCGRQEGFQVKKLMPEGRWGTTVVMTEASQPSEAGEMFIRSAFFEDGERLFTVGIMSPAAIWGSVEKQLEAMMASFALEKVGGPTIPVAPGTALPGRAKFVVEAGGPAVAASPGAAGVPDAPAGAVDLSAYALEDAQALEEEDEINVRFRDAGSGLVPRVLGREAGCVMIGAGALEAILPVPHGWHVVDDGRRTLVFDRGNKVQVSLTYVTIDGRGPSEIFTEIIAGLSAESPGVEHRVFEVEGYNAMQVRNLVIDGEPLQQAYLLKPMAARENLALKVRVTAKEEDLARAMDMTGVILGGTRWM